jgi:hypothetical protein
MSKSYGKMPRRSKCWLLLRFSRFKYHHIILYIIHKIISYHDIYIYIIYIRRPRQTQGGARQGIIFLTLVAAAAAVVVVLQ